ncbi:MAG: hypothetical protein IPL52_13870 [Flavobacteriales bacterium]|nr:hypothetical protein [Flavobacteriales bacterium]
MKPFDTTGTPSREQLLAYAQGRLSPEQQHEVEAHLERDPFLREAMEGLQLPGALAGLNKLNDTRPTSGYGISKAWWIGGAAAVLVATIGIMWYVSNDAGSPVLAEEPSPVQEAQEGPNTDNAPIASAEIIAATEQPAGDRIGHERMALHTREAARLVLPRDPGATRVDPRPFGLQHEVDSARPLNHRGPHHSVQLLFLHDLKIVDPREIYGNDPQLDLDEVHVAARYAEATQRDSARSQDVHAAYTAFMDEALARFKDNDHKACLDDLRFLLDQYPDDVNALFYAGLCAYNVGLHERARTLLHRAATHPIDVFDEEAAWYYALTLERMSDPGAPEAFQRIAAADGFYSELAKKRATDGR